MRDRMLINGDYQDSKVLGSYMAGLCMWRDGVGYDRSLEVISSSRALR